MFYGVKKGGKNIRGVFAFPEDKSGNKSTWYGLYTGNFNSLWKGYYHLWFVTEPHMFSYLGRNENKSFRRMPVGQP